MNYQREIIEQGEYWRFITGHFTHVNPEHLAINLLGLIFILLLNWSLMASSRGLMLTLFLCVWVSTGLWFLNPEVLGYSGLSGVLYGLFVLAVLLQPLFPLLWKVSLVLLVCFRVFLEQTSVSVVSEISLDLGVPVIYDAHFYGLTGGFLVALGLTLGQNLIGNHSVAVKS